MGKGLERRSFMPKDFWWLRQEVEFGQLLIETIEYWTGIAESGKANPVASASTDLLTGCA